MPGPTPSTSTQVVNNTLPEWVDNAGQSNYDEAVRIGEKPLEQFAGSKVAPMSSTTAQGISFFKDALPNLGNDTAAASDLFRQLGDPDAMAGKINGYMNPYIDNVETKSLDALDRNRQLALMGNADKAVASKAFGGSRSAIVDAITNSESIRDAGMLSAGLRKEGFDTASQLASNNTMGAGQGLLASGEANQAAVLKNFAALMQAGGAEQTQAQNELNDEVSKFNEVRDKDINALNLRLSSLGMTPYSTSSTTDTTTTQGSPGVDPASLILGLLTLGMGI